MFVSYVREDVERVDKLCRVLQAAQIPYWRDKGSLWPGDDWKAKIRQAIRDNSLVFLACFSDQSRARDRSHMNEELTLAVEEFRKLTPGRTWLIPVRFDSGPIPERDLGAGKVLSDLNYADLFGDEETVQTAALVTTISRLLGDDAADPATVQAVIDQATVADRPGILRRLTKEMLPDPARRIALDDRVRQEARRTVDAFRDPAHFPVDRLPGTGEEQIAAVVTQAVEAWRLVEPFVWSLEVAVRWATPDQLQPWIDALRSFAAEANKPPNGVTALLNLRYLPGTVSVMAVALAAVNAGTWANLKTLLVDQTAHEWRRDDTEPLVNVFNPWAPFRDDHDKRITCVLARSVLHGEDPATAAAAYADPNKRATRHYTPIAEWLHAILRPGFQDLYTDDYTYARDFDTAEVMLGIISQDFANQQNAGYNTYLQAHAGSDDPRGASTTTPATPSRACRRNSHPNRPHGHPYAQDCSAATRSARRPPWTPTEPPSSRQAASETNPLATETPGGRNASSPNRHVIVRSGPRQEYRDRRPVARPARVANDCDGVAGRNRRTDIPHDVRASRAASHAVLGGD